MKLLLTFLSTLFISISFSQKSNAFSGVWCHDLEDPQTDSWEITLNQTSKKGTSTLTVWGNQLYYHCTNQQQGDTLCFYFQSEEAGVGGASEIEAGNIKLPKKGKLIGKAILQNGQLRFVYKAKKMELGDTYNKKND